MKSFAFILLLAIQAGCTSHTGEIGSIVVSQDDSGGEILLACVSGVIAAGIKSKEVAFPEAIFMRPLKDLHFASTVKVVSKESGKTILESNSLHPQVYWKAKGGGIEYVGLHEIEIKGDRECGDYLISLHFERVPGGFNSAREIYARRSLRP